MSFPRLNSLLAICWMGCLCGAPSLAMASPDAPAVLFLEEDEPGRPAYAAMMIGFRRTLEQNFPGMVAIYPENLDLARFSNPDYRDEAGLWLRQKYRGKQINVIVASGPTSMELAKKFREEFWPDAHIVGISGASGNQMEREPGQPPDPISRLAVGLDVAGTLDAAKALMPEASRLVVVMGTTAAYAGMNEWILREAEAAAERHGLAMETLVGLSLDETRRQLSLLPRDVMVLYGSISQDGTGRSYIPRDVLVDLSRTSGAPIFGLSDSFMGYGMTGGSVLRMEELGSELAVMTAEAIMAPAEKTPASRESRASGIMFDWRELQKFGLARRPLPEGAELHFAPPSLWETHRNAVLVGGAFSKIHPRAAAFSVRTPAPRFPERGAAAIAAARWCPIGSAASAILNSLGSPGKRLPETPICGPPPPRWKPRAPPCAWPPADCIPAPASNCLANIRDKISPAT